MVKVDAVKLKSPNATQKKKLRKKRVAHENPPKPSHVIGSHSMEIKQEVSSDAVSKQKKNIGKVEVISSKKSREHSNRCAHGIDSTEGSNGGPSSLRNHESGQFQEVLEKIADVLDVREARKFVNGEVVAGRIDQSEFNLIMQKWRKLKLKMVRAMQSDKVMELEGTLSDIKKAVGDLVRGNKLKSWEAGDIIKRWKNRERRRIARQVSKQTSRACFHCRQQGHVLADCPNRDDAEITGNIVSSYGDGICFKCGSTEHSVHKCPRKHVQGFPFAKCFVCGCQGHLSRDCEKNAHGIYPDGGCCNMCGSKRHLKRDCPELAGQKQRKDEREVKVRAMSAMVSADLDNILDDKVINEEMKVKTGKKIVKF
ncbi:hypothetical protein V3C99_012042 [Haemonchus contortus]